MKKIILFALANLILVVGQAGAEATPNHVFQKTENIRAILEALNEANFSSNASSIPDAEPALPRHVLQLSREIWRKTQLLRFMNGLPTASLDPVPLQEITPTQVSLVVDLLIVQLEELQLAYGLQDKMAEASLPKGKTPGDVYANLLRISQLLDNLGVPTTVPNDVYQLASTVLLNGIALAEELGISGVKATLENVPTVSGKTPKDVFEETLAMIDDLSILASANDQLNPKGGVFKTTLQPQTITPSHVLQQLAKAGAEVNAMRAKVQVSSVSYNAPYLGGKTPSDVMYRVLQIRAVIGLISQSQQS